MLLLLSTLIITINACFNMSSIYRNHKNSNKNNFYFDPNSLSNTFLDMCNNGKNITLLNLNDTENHGMWSNKSMNCTEGDCYTWTYIIPPGTTLPDSFLTTCKLNYYVSHNLVVAYKQWDIETIHNLCEREIIFGSHFINAQNNVCNCISPLDILM